MGEQAGSGIMTIESLKGLLSRREFFHLVFFLFLISLVITFTFSDRWGFYQFSAGLNFLFYLLMVASAIRSGFIGDLFSKGSGWSLFVIFAVPLTLQLFLLWQAPSFSQDIHRLVFRGEAFSDGLLPYEEFEVNKPPMYIWLVGAISTLLGPSQMTFRAVFIVFNSLIPPLLYLIGNERGKLDNGSKRKEMVYSTAAFAYCLWPVGMMESGIAGHFDPVVVVVVLLSFLALKRNQYLLSGLFLGAGFALKMYPALLAPFFLLSIPRWKERIYLAAGFAAAPVISSIPFIVRDPSQILGYIFYQSSDWGVSLSLRFVIDQVLSSAGASTSITFPISILFLGLGMLLMILVAAGKFKSIVIEKTLLILFLFLSCIAAGYFCLILFSGPAGGLRIVLGISVLILFLISAAIASVNLSSRDYETTEREKEKSSIGLLISADDMPKYCALALLLLLLVSAQFHPWYLLWAAPFALVSSPRIGWTFLILSGPLHYLVYPPWDMGSFF